MNTSTVILPGSTVPATAVPLRPAGVEAAPTPLEVATAFYAAYLAGDLAAASALLAPDAVLHVPGTQPLAGDHVGLDAILGFIVGTATIVGDGSVTTELVDVTGGATHATALCIVTGQRRGRAVMVNHTAHVLRVEDGHIAEISFRNADQAVVDAFWS